MCVLKRKKEIEKREDEINREEMHLTTVVINWTERQTEEREKLKGRGKAEEKRKKEEERGVEKGVSQGTVQKEVVLVRGVEIRVEMGTEIVLRTEEEKTNSSWTMTSPTRHRFVAATDRLAVI